MTVTWRSRGGDVAVTWRSRGGQVKCVLFPGKDAETVSDALGEVAGFPVVAAAPHQLWVAPPPFPPVQSGHVSSIPPY